jgi:hypothetical protein
VYFVTQNPLDVPDVVLGQLGNRVQHALRAFTPRDQKTVRAAAQTLRPNPVLDVERTITELGVGEALVSLLDEKARPGVVERAQVCPPRGHVGALGADARRAIIAGSTLRSHYEQTVDRESAYEKLKGRAATPSPAGTGPGAPGGSGSSVLRDVLFGTTGPRGGRREGMIDVVAKSAARAAGSQLGRQILRGVFGSLLRGK